MLVDASILDRWVFDKMDDLLELAKTDTSLADKLKTEQSVIFLHLLGCDTAGHAFRPNTQGYCFYQIHIVN